MPLRFYLIADFVQWEDWPPISLPLSKANHALYTKVLFRGLVAMYSESGGN